MHIDDDVIARTAKASVAFGRLREKVLERNEIRLDTKLKVYKASVLPTLLYTCKTWTVYQRHTKRLGTFWLKGCLRKLKDKIPDTKVLKKAGMQSVLVTLKQCLMSDYQKTVAVENFKKERALNVAKKTLQLNPENRLQGSSKRTLPHQKRSSSVRNKASLSNWLKEVCCQ